MQRREAQRALRPVSAEARRAGELRRSPRQAVLRRTSYRRSRLRRRGRPGGARCPPPCRGPGRRAAWAREAPAQGEDIRHHRVAPSAGSAAEQRAADRAREEAQRPAPWALAGAPPGKSRRIRAAEAPAFRPAVAEAPPAGSPAVQGVETGADSRRPEAEAAASSFRPCRLSDARPSRRNGRRTSSPASTAHCKPGTPRARPAARLPSARRTPCRTAFPPALHVRKLDTASCLASIPPGRPGTGGSIQTLSSEILLYSRSAALKKKKVRPKVFSGGFPS